MVFTGNLPVVIPHKLSEWLKYLVHRQIRSFLSDNKCGKDEAWT